MTIVKDIKPRRRIPNSAYVDAPFDVAKKELKTAGYRIPSLEEMAQLRMQEGKDSNCFTSGSWVKEGLLYLPGFEGGIYLTKELPTLTNPAERSSFFLNQDQINEALYHSVFVRNNRRISQFNMRLKNATYTIPTDRFAESPVAVFAFGKTTKAYGQWLRDLKVNYLSFSLIDVSGRPFVRPLYDSGINRGYYSYKGIYGYYSENLRARISSDMSLKEKTIMRGIRGGMRLGNRIDNQPCDFVCITDLKTGKREYAKLPPRMGEYD